MHVRVFHLSVAVFTITLLLAAFQHAYGQGKRSLTDLKLADLDFISGQGYGEWNGGKIEEIWTKPSGDSMMGMFKYFKDGAARFYEFLLIEQTPRGLELKLKHFNPGLIGWEEKAQVYTYPLIAFEKDMAVFERPDKQTRLTFRRTSKNTLTVILEQTKEGKVVAEEFRYSRGTN